MIDVDEAKEGGCVRNVTVPLRYECYYTYRGICLGGLPMGDG